MSQLRRAVCVHGGLCGGRRGRAEPAPGGGRHRAAEDAGRLVALQVWGMGGNDIIVTSKLFLICL